MATLHYLHASRVEGATKYNLYKSDDKGNILGTRPITSMELLQEFPFLGAITDNGNVREKEYTLWANGSETNSAWFTPLRRVTENGIRYCLKVTGILYASIGSGLSERRMVDAVWDFPDDLEVDSFTSCHIHIIASSPFEKKEGDGYYLNCSLTAGYNSATNIQIRIFDLDPNITHIGFGKGTQSLTLHAGEYGDNRRHTEYIPIFTLGNGWQATGDSGEVCVGKFNLSDDNDYTYKKMAFYNKNLKYVGGVDNAWLAVYTASNEANSFYYKDSASGLYFTREGVLDIGEKITETSTGEEENYPEFVVFSSRKSTTADIDRVCFNAGYFPLFAMPDDDFDDGDNYLVVTADSISQYYRESDPSKAEKYTRVKQS